MKFFSFNSTLYTFILYAPSNHFLFILCEYAVACYGECSFYFTSFTRPFFVFPLFLFTISMNISIKQKNIHVIVCWLMIMAMYLCVHDIVYEIFKYLIFFKMKIWAKIWNKQTKILCLWISFFFQINQTTWIYVPQNKRWYKKKVNEKLSFITLKTWFCF